MTTHPAEEPSESDMDRFIETARNLGCDVDEKTLNEMMKKVAAPARQSE